MKKHVSDAIRHFAPFVLPESGTAQNAGTQLSYTTKYDFVQGDKIIAYEISVQPMFETSRSDGIQMEAQQLLRWIQMEGKMAEDREKGIFHPEFIKDLPDNFYV
jgi:hypothetical protein